MGVRELLHELHGAGFAVSAEAGRLLVRPASKLTDEQRAALRDAKAALLGLVSETPAGREIDSATDATVVAPERFEERAAVLEFDAGLPGADAEAAAENGGKAADWRAADVAYLTHHSGCIACKAAGRGSRYGERCSTGAVLWRCYEAA